MAEAVVERTPRAATAAPPPWRAAPAVALVVLVPLAVLPGGALPFQVPKAWLVAALVPAGLALAAATGPLRWPFARWWAAWLGAAAVSTGIGVAPWTALAGAPGRSTGLVALLLGAGAFVLGASLGDDAPATRRILRAAFATGGVVGALAVLERVGVPLPGLDDDAQRVRSTWGSATFLAGHVVLVAPLAVVHLRAAHQRWRRAALASTVAMAAALVLSGTRGAWLGALAAAVVLAPALPRRGGATKAGAESSGARRSAWLVGASVAAALLAALAVAGPMLDRASAGGRLDLWRTTTTPIADRPLFGSGPDTQRIVLPSGIDRTFEQRHGSVELHDRAHQLVLDTWLTTGLAGVVALGGLLVAIGRHLAARLAGQVVGRAIVAGLVGYLVHLSFAFGDVVLDPIAWLLAGIATTALPAAAGAPDDGADGAGGAGGPRWMVVAGAVLALAAIVAGTAEVAADRRLARAVELDRAGDRLGAIAELDRAPTWAPQRWDLWQARSRVAERVLLGGSAASGLPDPRRDPAALERFTATAFADVDRALAAAPDDPDLLLDRAALLDAASRHEEAAAAFRAVLDGPYPHSSRAWLGLGTARANQGDPSGALDAWGDAAALAPADVRALTNVAILHASAGRTAAALDALDEALARRPDDPALLALRDQLRE